MSTSGQVMTLPDTIYSVLSDVSLLCPSKLTMEAYYGGLLFYIDDVLKCII